MKVLVRKEPMKVEKAKTNVGMSFVSKIVMVRSVLSERKIQKKEQHKYTRVRG